VQPHSAVSAAECSGAAALSSVTVTLTSWFVESASARCRETSRLALDASARLLHPLPLPLLPFPQR